MSMISVKEALTELCDGNGITVRRSLVYSEIQEIKDLSKENGLFDIIGNSFDYGFYLGWKHCEAEQCGDYFDALNEQAS